MSISAEVQVLSPNHPADIPGHSFPDPSAAVSGYMPFEPRNGPPDVRNGVPGTEGETGLRRHNGWVREQGIIEEPWDSNR